MARQDVTAEEAEEGLQIEPLEAPKFRSEAEEAEWWESHPEVATEIMKRAIKTGKAHEALERERRSA